ncbi:MAG: glycosyltransferase [Bacteroidales bacterium]|nr:glycosyltransferase [Bacteroidales bacterium]
MKIILLGPAWPYRGGIADFNDRLAAEFHSRGDEVEVVTFTLQYPKFLFPGKTQYNDKPAPSGWTTRRMMNSCNPLSWIRTGFYLRRHKADLVISAFWLPFMAPCMGTILRLARCKKTHRIALLHNLIPHEHRIGDRLFARYFVKSNDSFAALSHSVLDDLSQFNSKKPRTFCPHPLYDHYGTIVSKQEARQKLGLQSDGRYALFFGFIRGYKGLDLLLDAMGDERLRKLDVKLLVAGEFYDDPQPYRQQIEQLGIGDRVILHSDFIADSEVGNFFCASDIITQPYKSATQSGVTQIAFHFEKPMLVTNVGGLAEIVHNGKMGYVVEPKPSEIADALVEYYSNQREESFTNAVREEKKKYSWDKLTTALVNLNSITQ